MKKRDSYWQIVRGICILAVVMIHCPNALAYSRDSMDYNGWIVLRQIIDFPVPVFVFMAGYFARQDKCLESPLGYLKTRGGGIINSLLSVDNSLFCYKYDSFRQME